MNFQTMLTLAKYFLIQPKFQRNEGEQNYKNAIKCLKIDMNFFQFPPSRIYQSVLLSKQHKVNQIKQCQGQDCRTKDTHFLLFYRHQIKQFFAFQKSCRYWSTWTRTKCSVFARLNKQKFLIFSFIAPPHYNKFSKRLFHW